VGVHQGQITVINYEGMTYSSSRYILGGYDPAKFWVGGNDLVTEGQWMWATTHTRIIDTGCCKSNYHTIRTHHFKTAVSIEQYLMYLSTLGKIGMMT
jgi:hypothetical protein